MPRTQPPPTTADPTTAQQRDTAVTIYERSVEGRRAAVLPPTDVPENPIDELIPSNLLRGAGPNLAEVLTEALA